MTTLIEIRPIPPTFAAEAERRKGDLYERQSVLFQFVDAGTAAGFMIGKHWGGWKLYIRGRLYNWPREHGLLKRRILIDHIMHCIDTDIAFYGYD